MKKMFTKSLLTAAVTAAVAMPVHAYNLHSSDAGELNLDVEMILGVFSSDETYNTFGGPTGESRDWQEGYVKYGLSGTRNLENGAVLFGAANALTSGVWGDGDALGAQTGDERETEIEDLYVGFRNDVFEISAGRQNVTIGDGFLLNGDSLNLGEGFGHDFNRGGGYWLAARKAFDQTVVARFGGEEGLRSDIFWIESDNAAQSSMELAGANVEYVTETGTFAGMYIEGLGVDATEAAINGNAGRDGQKTMSLRYQGSAGVENLFLSAEFVNQEDGITGDDTQAFYGEAGWTFADVAWTPSVNYRYTSYDEGFDSLFFGFNRGYGTWFQGEVAANYAGPFGSDADIHYLGVTANPSEMVTVGAAYFDFKDTVGGTGTNDANEINLWAEWVVTDNLIVSPLVGFYTPDADTSTQGNDDTNTYFQVLAIVPF